jgi:phosphate-selective porin OprO/OprP
MKALLPVLLTMIVSIGVPKSLVAQGFAEPNQAQAPNKTPPQPAPQQTQASNQPATESTLEDTIDAGEAQEPPKRQLVKWNQFKGPYFTGRFGAGFLIDMGAFAQDDESKEQIAVHPDEKLRDFRFIMGGKLFPNLKRAITWNVGIMYDGPNHAWLIRQTGVMIAVPELWGHFFIGRTKEGFSLNKVMVGYDGWTMERSTMNDATIPILADGFKWLGSTPNHRFLWNLGYYNDIFSKGQSFSSYSSQEVARLIWLPIHSDETRQLFHLGVNLRHGKPVDGNLRLKSRPESFVAPFFVDTGTFKVDSTRMAGPEIYYRNGPWMFGSEYWWLKASSTSEHDPVFHGGDVFATYLITGETRTYNMVGGYFRDISPARTVFQGGPGAWELVFRYSNIDLDSRNLQGGRFRRFTPMVNWYLSDNVRLEIAYGYGHLDRFDLKGNTQFFQTRLQLQF